METTINQNVTRQQHWLRAHYEALQRPRSIECAIVALRSGLLAYGTEYEERYGGDATLGRDGVLGESWLQLARGYLGLLNGETGRLDCGSLDGEVRRWAAMFGFAEEL